MALVDAEKQIARLGHTGCQHLDAIRIWSDGLTVAEDVLEIEGWSTVDLIQEFGSPLYVVSETTLRQNYRRLAAAFKDAWPTDVTVLYAIKTNNNLAIRAILHEEGAGGDCFGEGELYATFLGGVDSRKVVLNGSNKSYNHLRHAALLGITTNIDAVDEIDFLEAIARQEGIQARVNLRLNIVPPEFDRTGRIRARQWGFSVEGAGDLVRRLMRTDGLSFEGYHLHIGRASANLAFYEEWAKRLGEGVVLLYEATGFVPQILDVGGGYARERDAEAVAAYTGGSRLEGDPGPFELNPHTIEDYARVVSTGLLSPLKEAGLPAPDLAIEPGRYIAGNAEVLLARVGPVKKDAGRVWINIDASINNIMRRESHNYTFHILPASRMNDEFVLTADIVGPLCTGRPLGEGRPMPDLTRGDVIAILDAGMYAETMSTQMNGIPRPATVLVCRGQVDLIKHRETVSDVFAKHRIPERLLRRSRVASERDV